MCILWHVLLLLSVFVFFFPCGFEYYLRVSSKISFTMLSFTLLFPYFFTIIYFHYLFQIVSIKNRFLFTCCSEELGMKVCTLQGKENVSMFISRSVSTFLSGSFFLHPKQQSTTFFWQTNYSMLNIA